MALGRVKRIISFVTAMTFTGSLNLLNTQIGSEAAAQDLSAGFVRSEEVQSLQHGAEFASGMLKGRVLMKVNLWGAVTKPGIHYIPAHTDLVTFLSYAGGPDPNADLSGVVIKRQEAGKEKSIPIDVLKLVKDQAHENPALEVNDIVVVPSKRPLISNDTVGLIGIISGTLSSILAIYLIRDETRR